MASLDLSAISRPQVVWIYAWMGYSDLKKICRPTSVCKKNILWAGNKWLFFFPWDLIFDTFWVSFCWCGWVCMFILIHFRLNNHICFSGLDWRLVTVGNLGPQNMPPDTSEAKPKRVLASLAMCRCLSNSRRLWRGLLGHSVLVLPPFVAGISIRIIHLYVCSHVICICSLFAAFPGAWGNRLGNKSFIVTSLRPELIDSTSGYWGREHGATPEYPAYRAALEVLWLLICLFGKCGEDYICMAL